MEYGELTEEQKAKARECTSPAELAAFAKEECIELSDAQLDAMSGGREWYEPVTDCTGRGPGGL